MRERDFDKGYKSGFQFGKEVANVEWLNKIKQAREEIQELVDILSDDTMANITMKSGLGMALEKIDKLIESEDEDV